MAEKASLRQRLRERVEDWICGPPDLEPAVPFRRVLYDELRLIRARRARARGAPPAKGLQDLQASSAISAELTGVSGAPGEPPPEHVLDRIAQREALTENLTGLAFSGGGIRSATFNLGFIQGLCDLRLLGRFDYLSTVSGGGYVGSWLTALLDRENRRQAAAGDGLTRVERRLRTRRSSGQTVEDPAITFLRQHSNYLSPKVGLLTADAWSIVATYLRNLLLNLLVLIPGLAFFLLLPRLLVTGREAAAAGLAAPGGLALSVSVAVLLAMCATLVTGYNMASLAATEDEEEDVDEDRRANSWLQLGTIQKLLVLPLLAAAFIAGQRLPEIDRGYLTWAGAVAGLWALSWALSWGVAKLISPWRAHQKTSQWLLLILWAAVSGAAGGCLLKLIVEHLRSLDRWTGYVWGAPLILLWFVVLGVLETGLMGREMRDRQREWLNRLGAWLLIYLIVWAAIFSLVVHAPVLLMALKGWVQMAIASGWVAATVGGLLAGRRAADGGGKLRALIAAVTPYVFAAGLIAALAVGLDWTVSRIADGGESWRAFTAVRNDLVEASIRAEEARAAGADEVPAVAWLAPLHRAHGELLDAAGTRWGTLLALVLGTLATAAFFAWRIDVNDFSMHRFYRNRLVRAYLGASVDPEERARRRQPFTGFYQGDDLPLRGTWKPQERGILLSERGPLHLINVALNLVAGDELAWQQRKAASFVLTPLYCGFDTRGQEVDPRLDPNIERYGYRRAERYGSHPATLTLGSSFAISGAAASPNMGFRTTPAFAFLLAVFNVRLGWWLGNPRHRRAWTRSGPLFALVHLLMEVFGKTRGRTRYVYLSDGGHFENLGLYELVRRRCRFIVACDAGADPEHSFQDLGGAIRKCRADFGVEIDLDLDPIRRGDDGLSRWHCAVGTIRYDRDREDRDRGLLLYVKASLTGDEPEDVRNYARENPTFPHQTTADQFFDESQFESYRRLGHHVALAVLGRAVERATELATAAAEDDDGHVAAKLSLERLWLALRQRWERPSRAVAAAFTRHTATLDRLFERLQSNRALAFLDGQIYPEWRRFLSGADDLDELPPTTTLWLPPKATDRREGFYFCNSLIQLMENVYIDLNLETDYAHSDNRGWMNLFKHWSWSGMFRAAWAISAATYGRRFQAFCTERLGLELGEVDATALAGDGPIDAAAFAARIEGADPTFLNFLEREQIDLYLRYAGAAAASVEQLELVIRGGGEGAELLRFGFGYLLRDDAGRVMLFRVQDHLRTMGLARRALDHVARREKEDRRRVVLLSLPPDARRSFRAVLARMAEAVASGRLEPPERAACERFCAEFDGGERRFVELLRSLRRELRVTG